MGFSPDEKAFRIKMKLFKLLLLIFLITTFGCGTRRSATKTSSSSKNVEEKNSQLLGVTKSDISNKKLYSFIEEWHGVPYKYAGKTKKGVDCSGFTSILIREVYAKEISGSSQSIYKQCKSTLKENLKEGDLVFFKIDSKEVSHVGIYLQNNKFVHATTKAGVMIDDLDEAYYKKYFSGGGTIR